MGDDIEYTTHEENLRDAYRDETAFEGQCPARNSAGERCARLIHFTERHTWEV